MERNLVVNKNAKVEVTKKFEFEAAHKLLNYDGACAFLHGHTYKLRVTLKGRLDEIGMVLDFKELKEIVNTLVINKLDHAYLNEILPYNTTAENMVVDIFYLLKGFIEQDEELKSREVELKEVTLYETSDSYATYKGE